jgi:hypothetical protein
MLTWRIRRQFIILSIALIPFVAIGFWVFSKFLPQPACTDNIKNQEELAVDCGGPCGPCELKNPKPLTLFWARVVPAREGVYDVAAEIQNENTVLSSTNLEYEFTLSDDLGPVAFRKGKTFVFAQERLHVIEANIPTVRSPTKVVFKVTSVDWQFRKEPKPNIVVEKRDYRVEEPQGRKQSIIDTTLVNRTSLNFKSVEVLAIVLDRDGNLLGANRAIADNLIAASRKDARLLWPTEIFGIPALIIVEPRVNIFDPNIVIKP